MTVPNVFGVVEDSPEAERPNVFGVTEPTAKKPNAFGIVEDDPLPAPARALAPPAAKPSSVVRRAVADPLLDLASGLVAVPKSIVGLGSIATGGRVGRGVDAGMSKAGLTTLTESSDYWQNLKSPEAKEAQRRVSEAEGFTGKIATAIRNPSTISSAVIQSAPGMFAGGGIARVATKILPKLAPIAMGIGEGAIGAGASAENIRESSPDKLLSLKQSGLAAVSGVGTAALGVMGGKLAAKLKIVDPDTWAAGMASPETALPLWKRVIGGAVSEGLFEELPQSVQEQMLQNEAMGKPLMEGVAESAAMGTLAGAAMGAGVNVVRRPAGPAPIVPPTAQPVSDPAAGAPVATEPVQTGGGVSIAPEAGIGVQGQESTARPTPEDIQSVLSALADKIASGNRNYTPEELELQSNYPQEIESILKSKYSPERSYDQETSQLRYPDVTAQVQDPRFKLYTDAGYSRADAIKMVQQDQAEEVGQPITSPDGTQRVTLGGQPAPVTRVELEQSANDRLKAVGLTSPSPDAVKVFADRLEAAQSESPSPVAGSREASPAPVVIQDSLPAQGAEPLSPPRPAANQSQPSADTGTAAEAEAGKTPTPKLMAVGYNDDMSIKQQEDVSGYKLRKIRVNDAGETVYVLDNGKEARYTDDKSAENLAKHDKFIDERKPTAADKLKARVAKREGEKKTDKPDYSKLPWQQKPLSEPLTAKDFNDYREEQAKLKQGMEKSAVAMIRKGVLDAERVITEREGPEAYQRYKALADQKPEVAPPQFRRETEPAPTEPLWHGTKYAGNDIKPGGGKDLHGQGIWFTAQKGYTDAEGNPIQAPADDPFPSVNASEYAVMSPGTGKPRLVRARLSIKNPAKIFDTDIAKAGITVAQLKAQGFDGAHMLDTGAWVAFDPEQVKVEGEPSNKPDTALATAPSLALKVEGIKTLRAIGSYEEAGRIVDQMRKDSGLGSSDFPRVEIVDTKTGKTVATVSYNGRIWENDGGPQGADAKEIERVDGRGYGKKEAIEADSTKPAEGEGEVKQPWEMTGPEFEQAVKRGKIVQATGKKVAGEESAKTPLRMGELNGYSSDDIAHFYAKRRGYPNSVTADYDPIVEGRKELVTDALREGKPVPGEVIDELGAKIEKPLTGTEKLRGKKRAPESTPGTPESTVARPTSKLAALRGRGKKAAPIEAPATAPIQAPTDSQDKKKRRAASNFNDPIIDKVMELGGLRHYAVDPSTGKRPQREEMQRLLRFMRKEGSTLDQILIGLRNDPETAGPSANWSENDLYEYLSNARPRQSSQAEYERKNLPNTPEDYAALSLAAKTKTFNEAEIDPQALVVIGEEIYKAKRTEDGKLLQDGVSIPLKDFDTIEAKSVVSKDDIAYPALLKKYKAQKKAKTDKAPSRDPLSLERQTPADVESDRATKAKSASKAKMDAEAAKPLIAREIDTTGSLLEGVEPDNPLFAARRPPRPEIKSPTANLSGADAARLKEIQDKLRKKIMGQANMGFDPEILTLAGEMATLYAKGGIKTFKQFAGSVRADMADMWDQMKSYLHSAWQAAGAVDESLEDIGRKDAQAVISGIDTANAKDETITDKENDNAPGSTGDLEQDSALTVPKEPVGQGNVQLGSERGAEGDGVGRSEVEGARLSVQGDLSLPDGDAVAGRASGDSGIRQTPPGTGAGVARRSNEKRSRVVDVERPDALTERSATVDEVVADSDDSNPDIVERAHQGIAGRLIRQKIADKVKVSYNDRANIEATLPLLFDGQKDDVAFAESRFSKENGYGVMFTNGTGTGKTYTGMGLVKRMVQLGRSNILIVAPSDQVMSGWVEAGKDLGITITMLPDTSSSGKGVTITTYANLGQNNNLAKRKWDLVVADESHYLSSNKAGELTSSAQSLRALTGHPQGVWKRTHMLHPDIAEKIHEARRAGNNDRLNELQKEFHRLHDGIESEVKANQGFKRPRVVFLSATPFAYPENVDYAEGFLFNYREPGENENQSRGYNEPDPRGRFFVTHFGYRMRTGRLTKPDAGVDSDIMERQFNEWLRKEGVLSRRMLDVEADYQRKFVTVDDLIGRKIDEGMEFLRSERDGRYSALADIVNKRFDYHSRMFLLEALKARHAVPLIREQLKRGRKVVVFHDFTVGGGFNPFSFSDSDGKQTARIRRPDGSYEEIILGTLIQEFKDAKPEMQELQFASLQAPVLSLKASFPDAMLFNGTVSKKDRRKTVQDFNKDDSGKNLIIVQNDAGREGISLHDTSGKHRRVEINLGLPIKPTAAIQEEGRIYRTGQHPTSHAMFIYMNTGTNFERFTFAQKIFERAATAENLAMGEDARTLRESFVEAFEDAEPYEFSEQEGIGGKAKDRQSQSITSDFDRAKSFYFANQKRTSRDKSREGQDYFATPEPIGQRMVAWLKLEANEGVLEPSAGHGAISRWFPENTRNTVIEPSSTLLSKASLTTSGRMLSERFEDHDIHNKYGGIAMNPPFGTAGRTAVDHVAKAFIHLKDGGRIVAIIPDGPSAGDKFTKWYEATDGATLVASVSLPAATFERAGTSVRTRIVVIDKVLDKDTRQEQRSPLEISGETIAEVFDAIENMDMPDRIKPKSISAPASILTTSRNAVLPNQAQEMPWQDAIKGINFSDPEWARKLAEEGDKSRIVAVRDYLEGGIMRDNDSFAAGKRKIEADPNIRVLREATPVNTETATTRGVLPITTVFHEKCKANINIAVP